MMTGPGRVNVVPGLELDSRAGVAGSSPSTAGDTSESGNQTSSPVNSDGFFDQLLPSELAIAGACIAAGLLVFLGVILWIQTRRRRKKLLKDLTFNDYEDESKITKSAPNSRCPSPRASKRMSCPDAFAKSSKSGVLLVRSLTFDPIQDSTFTPECVQPKAGHHMSSARHKSNSRPPEISTSDEHRTLTVSDEVGKDLSPSSTGRIWFSTFHDSHTGKLNVYLIKVIDLPKRAMTNEERDPFVKIFLLPDDKICQVSKYKKNTCSPVFNELHTFQVTEEHVKERILRFSVYDMDKRRVRHSLGHIMINLKDIDLDEGHVVCSDLEQSVKSNSSLGDLQLSLAYMSTKEKVKIGIHKARKLHIDEPYQEKGAYVKVQLYYGQKCHRIKRTVTRQISENCPFNESLSFTIQGRQLESCSLVISVMITHPREFNTDDVEYGHIVIGPFMYARGNELMHWQEMMSHPKTVTTHWHSLVNTNIFTSRDSQ